jgi:hypothetical protein
MYLGSVIDEEGGMANDVDLKIRKARRALEKHGRLWRAEIAKKEVYLVHWSCHC